MKKAILKPQVDSIIKYQDSLRSLLIEYIETPDVLLNRKSAKVIDFLKQHSNLNERIKKENVRIKELPYFISLGYKYIYESLDLVKNSIKIEEENILFTEENKSKNIDSKAIERLYSYFDAEMKYCLKFAFIHGSCADNTITEFSDLDTFLIIRKSIVFNVSKLENFRKKYRKSIKYLYSYDVLQHHSHIICTEIDLKFFPYHWLPPQILYDAKLLIGQDLLKINIYRNINYMRKHFLILLERFKKEKMINKKYNLYTLKNDLSVVFLLPVLYAQLLGRDLTKREALQKVNFEDDKLFEIYLRLSNLRMGWKVPNYHKVIFHLLNNNTLGRRFYIKVMPTIKYFDFIIKNKKVTKGFVEDMDYIINWFLIRINNVVVK